MDVRAVLIGDGSFGVAGRDSHRSALVSRTGEERAVLASMKQERKALENMMVMMMVFKMMMTMKYESYLCECRRDPLIRVNGDGIDDTLG